MTDYAELTGAKLNALIATGRGWTKINTRRQLWRNHDDEEALLPDWCSSLDRAWELFAEMTRAGWGRYFSIDTEGQVCLINAAKKELVERVWKCATPARAICEVWLWWWKEQQSASAKPTNEWEPDTVSAPGETLQEFIDERGISI